LVLCVSDWWIRCSSQDVKLLGVLKGIDGTHLKDMKMKLKIDGKVWTIIDPLDIAEGETEYMNLPAICVYDDQITTIFSHCQR